MTTTTVDPDNLRDKERMRAIRAWAQSNGRKIGDRGRIPADIITAYEDAHRVPDEPVVADVVAAGPGKRYSATERAAALSVVSDVGPALAADKLGINVSTLRSWQARAAADAAAELTRGPVAQNGSRVQGPGRKGRVARAHQTAGAGV